MFKSSFQNVQKREEGQGLVEYALILVLVSVVVVVVLSQVGPSVGNIFSEVVTALNNGVGAEEEEDGNCTSTGTGLYVNVPSDNAMNFSEGMQYSDADCSIEHGMLGRDTVYTPGGGDVASATNLCTTHFGSTLLYPNNASSRLYATGFWYCNSNT